MAAKEKARNDLEPACVAILAALEPSEALLKDPGPALRDAARLIAKTPELLATDFGRMLKENFAKWSADVDFATGWGFFDGVPPEGGIPFAEVVQQSWCGYKTERRLAAFLRDFGYPEKFRALGVITKVGYEKVLVNKIAKKRAKDADRKRRARAKQVP
jgi:hypothetical protein